MKKPIKFSAILIFFISGLLVTLGFTMIFAAFWFTRSFNSAVGLDSVIFTLFSDMHGVDSGLVNSYLLEGLLPTVMCSAAVISILIALPRILSVTKLKKYQISQKLHKTIALVLAATLMLSLFVFSANHIGLFEYLAARQDSTKIFDEHYVNPADVEIEFPEEKRNLIYIYLESMENTFMDEENGGAISENLIPELTELAKNNLNFSQSEGIGGAQTTTGSTWTIAAMVTQTSGVPLCLPDDIWENGLNYYSQVLPGLNTLTNILQENGYYQTLMVGSDASFGGRREFFSQHGIDKIYDLFTAREELLPEQDYYDDFWGYEDFFLFRYAQQKLTEISKQEKPFAFTMLTVDTHHPEGHPCQYCKLRSTEGLSEEEAKQLQFEDVLSCSSRQVSRFVQWIQEQDFYENTTVIITGDHYSMNNDYFNAKVPEEYVRRVYNCFLNTPISPKQEKNREFTTLDMLPTTLASMGCKIEGDRLGLGTNLFSDQKTLCELISFEYLKTELNKVSPFYEKTFLYGTRKTKGS
ncbi:MAG: sulfatase-like hydrolase/transferase [Clostridia bacterium]|nr:sulfatase-like hydrolase/transferase [Clostridia bacterium]